jgi:L-ascorbate metabolism protein UlaG (beta-lactamase superfamily)
MKKPVNVVYLGGPTVIFEIGGLRIMTDPTLDPSGSLFPISPVDTIEKLTGPATLNFGKIDIVLLSHDQHGDNLDKAGRELLQKVDKTFTTEIAAERLKGTAVGMSPWETIVITTPDGDELSITATPARHGPTGVEKLAGDVIGFVLSINDDKSPEIYLTGDTVFYEGVKEVAERFKPKYVFAFAGAAKPLTPFILTMGSNDVIDTAFAFPGSIIIPLHFEGWSHYSETGEMLIQSFNALGIANRFRILPAGEKIELV